MSKIKGGKSKMYSFQQHALISAIAKSLASLRGIGESEYVEEILINSFLPKHPSAKWIVSQILYAEDEGIKNSLNALFQLATAGLNVPDLRPFIDFARQQELQGKTSLEGNEIELPHLRNQADSIISHLESIWKQQNKERQPFDDIALGMSLINDLDTVPSCCNIFNFYIIIIRNWDDLKDLSVTYRLLADLVKVSHSWREDSEKRGELLILLQDESLKWPENAFSV